MAIKTFYDSTRCLIAPKFLFAARRSGSDGAFLSLSPKPEPDIFSADPGGIKIRKQQNLILVSNIFIDLFIFTPFRR